MRIPDKETLEELRRQYPVGCRIVLDEMDDPYTKIPIGSQGECRGVDDAGNVMVSWDMGSSLSIAYGADRVHKVSTEDEAVITLNWHGAHQLKTDSRCPRCGDMMFGPTARHALSRYAQIYVCDRCGMEEALEQAEIIKMKPLTEWCAVKLPSIGGGAWRR